MNIYTIPSINSQKDFCDKNLSDSSPFISSEFFEKLESNKCTNINKGWIPEHIIIEENKKVVGMIPNFRKLNSNGEYVFDHIFANAYNSIGLEYYPKYLSAIPFTPVNRKKFIYSSKSIDNNSLYRNLIKLFIKKGISSFHINFIERNVSETLKNFGFFQRLGIQYYWYNDSYINFESFLSKLKRKKRKNILKERNYFKENKINFSVKKGVEIKKKDIDLFYQCYQHTIRKKWSIAYLNNSFFTDLLNSNIRSNLILVQAHKGDDFLGCALHFLGDDTIYGRYWGALHEVPYLHFELCYYQAIEFAIKNKIKKIEAGAQGEHKISRGYVPKITYSNHWFDNHKLSGLINDFFIQERKKVMESVNYLESFVPFKD